MTEDYFVQRRREFEERLDRQLVGIVLGVFVYYFGGMACFAYFDRSNDTKERIEQHQIGSYTFTFHCTEREKKENQCAKKENLAFVDQNITLDERLWDMYAQSGEQKGQGETK